MKSQSIILAVCCVIAASVAWADDTASTSKPAKSTSTEKVTSSKKEKAKTPDPAIKTEKGVLTGSYIPQTVRRNGRITDGHNQVVVLDRADIERSGGADLRQVLVHTGTH